MKRKSRCGECLGCRSSNCRSCVFCLDMTQYGGNGKMKQACSKRICNIRNFKSAKKSFKSSDGIEDTIPPIVNKTNRRGRKCKIKFDELQKPDVIQNNKDEKQLSSINPPRKRGRPAKSIKLSHKIQQKKQKIINDNLTCDTSEEMIKDRHSSIKVPRKRGRPHKIKDKISPKVRTSQAKQSSSSNENEDVGNLNGSDIPFVNSLWNRMGSAGMSEKSFNTEEEESLEVQQNFVNIPGTMNIKQENSSDEDEDIKIEFVKILKTPTTLSIKQENEKPEKQSFTHPTRELSINGQIITLTAVEKPPLGPSVSPSNPTQHSGPSVFRGISTQPPGTPKFPVNYQDGPRFVHSATPLPSAPNGVTITPIESSSSNTSSTGSSGSTPLGSFAGNSSSTGPSGETNGQIHDGDIAQRTKSSGHLTVTIGNGDININNGGCTVQMKLNDVSIAGDADEVIKLVTKAAQHNL